MNRGDDVWTAMREIRLPAELEVGEAYGRVGWSVRAIWEGYAGWFHQHSTLELYPAPPETAWAEVVGMAGGPEAVAARASACSDALTAVRLCEMALAVEPEHEGALRAYVAAHERLLADHDAATGEEPNFWLTKWLEGEVASARNRLARSTGDIDGDGDGR
jgi:alkyl sulfatase BDS1-like metallo-beta-lactamase superfamily hydrolase